MRFFGIDPSLRATGMAAVDATGHLYWSDIADPPEKMRGVTRLCYLRARVRDSLKRIAPDVVMVEGYSFGSKARHHALGEWGGVLRVLLADFNIRTLVLPPQSLKKFATGRGDTKGKEPMAKALHALTGLSGFTEDQVDAAWLALAARALSTRRYRMAQYEREALAKAELIWPL